MKQESHLTTNRVTIIPNRCLILLIISIVLSCTVNCARISAPREIEIASYGISKYRIVVADDASHSTMHGAIELQMFLYRITGAVLPIFSDRLPMRNYEIIIGENEHLNNLDLDIDFTALGDEGYVLKTAGTYLVIAGGEVRGNLYGVYGLLEDHIGCRWFSSEVSRIPEYDRLGFEPLDEVGISVIEYREPYVWEAFNGDWAARNRMNRNSKSGGLESRHGGKIEWVDGMFVHTFDKLVPPDEYFRKHPEYFSKVGGRRRRRKTQLCCTNEEVVQIVTEGVLKAFRENPQAYVLSVSHNDCDNHCECLKCQTLAEKEESQIAPVLWMVNRVAEEVEKEFPDKVIETLAYQWTRKAPKTMRPRQNVVIRLCTIECCFAHPLDGCDSPENIEFVRDLREWSKIADRLWVWNYVTSFAHYFVPFPNLRIRNNNIKLFVENNVDGIFQQDVYTTPCGELSELSGYLNAKLLWNPMYDEDTAINEFLDGVYGPAAEPIRAYVDMLHGRVEDDNIHMNIWTGPDAEYLTDGILARSDSLWDDAELLVEHMPDVHERVMSARLSVDYALIESDRNRGDAWLVDHEKLLLDVNPAFTELVGRFCKVAGRAGVEKLKEYGYTVEEYNSDIEKQVKPRSLKLLKSRKRKLSSQGLVYRYYEGKWKKLPEFNALKHKKSGSTERFQLPFEGNGEAHGFTFEGFITVPRKGVYAFYSRSDGFSSISIGSQRVVSTNGSDPVRERRGFVALDAGSYPVKATFFTREDGRLLKIYYSGPGIEKQEIPASCFK